MSRLPSVPALLSVLVLGLAGCLRVPQADLLNQQLNPPPPPPVVPAMEEAALAIGPPLRLDDIVLQSDDDALERLQNALADLKETKDAHEELTARQRADAQRAAALEVELNDLRARLAQSAEQLKLKGELAKKTQADLDAARATLAQVQPRLAEAEKGAAETQKLAAALKEATAESEKLRDQLLQAELARVKAQQDLIALQIVMARQQALLKRRPKTEEARATTPPPPSNEETLP